MQTCRNPKCDELTYGVVVFCPSCRYIGRLGLAIGALLAGVIKAEYGTLGRFQNQREWLVWESVKDMPKLARWFAPCLMVSPAGLWLVQERTHPVTLFECRKAFARIPESITDLKAENFGRLPDGRIVCHDYGYALTAENGLSTRMKKAEWRS